MHLKELKEKVDAAMEQVVADEIDPSDVSVNFNLTFGAQFSMTTENGATHEAKTVDVELNNLKVQDTDFDGDSFNFNLGEE
jgi:hypothetical protein